MARGRRADKIKAATALELSEKLGHSERQIAKEVGLPASTVHTILSKAHGWGEIADEPVFRQNRAQQNRALKQAARSTAAKAMERAEDKIDEAGFYHLTLGAGIMIDKARLFSRRKHAKRSDPVEKRSHEPGSPCRSAFSGVAGV
jgi:predicted transcriptional regulator